MKQLILKSGSVLVLCAVASPAFAHSGDHSANMLQTLAHFLTQGDHLVMGIGAIILTFCIVRSRPSRHCVRSNGDAETLLDDSRPLSQ